MDDGGSVVLIEDITERRNSEARISHMARFDELTGLPNRVSFRDEIGRRLAAQERDHQLSALLFVDLDQFKQVNDTLGHPCGDRLLCMVTERLRNLSAQVSSALRARVRRVQPETSRARSRAMAGASRGERAYRIDPRSRSAPASASPCDAGVTATAVRTADMALSRAKADAAHLLLLPQRWRTPWARACSTDLGRLAHEIRDEYRRSSLSRPAHHHCEALLR